MTDYDIRDELLGEAGARPLLRPKHLAAVAIVVAAALYLYHLFYGGSSLLRLLELKDDRAALETRIGALKEENAKLRRDLYELQLIHGESVEDAPRE